MTELPLVLLQPFWLLPAFVLGILAFLRPAQQAVDHWQRVIAKPVLHYLQYRASTADNSDSADLPQGEAPSTRLYHTNRLLWVATIVTLSLTEPSIRVSDDNSWRHSIGWIAVLDVSRSMTLDDTLPSRLGAARQSLAVLSEAAGARPIALIVFAGDAFLLSPPAFDTALFDEYAALIEHGIIHTEGSNLARALSLAGSVINDSDMRRARVFLLHDSGGINPRSIAAARYLADNGHQLDVLTYGHSDPAYSQLQTAVDKAQVRELAEAGNGQAVFASVLGAVDYQPLHLRARENASAHAELKALVWRNQSHWLLLAALPLLLMQFYYQLYRQSRS